MSTTPRLAALVATLDPTDSVVHIHSWAKVLSPSIGRALAGFSQTSVLYAVLYFVLVFVFTYFYTAVTFDPHQMSENLQKGGAFVPGIRPGQATEQYLGKVVSRITLVGALFLGIIAVTLLEILVAFLQAYVFAILTCIYLNDAVNLH